LTYIDAAGELPYSGIIDCFVKSVKREGFLNLWVGLPTYYFRVAPHAMISILVQDYLHDMLSKRGNK
jgi:solute carrier family 25 oxoglutarate transporter 11